MDERDEAPAVSIPIDTLTAQALQGLIEAFVLREGTDYGHTEHQLDEKVAAVRRQLERGDAEIVFDPNSESVTILTGRDRAGAPARGNDARLRNR